MRSSYIKNNYSYLFDAIVRIHRPQTIVECGVLDGYSLMAMASAAKTYDPPGTVWGIDLFDEYVFKHGNKEEIQKDLDSNGLTNVELMKNDAYGASFFFKDNCVDLLHIDISNTGERLRRMLVCWKDKLKVDGILIFEGGSKDRDNVPWMKQYDDPDHTPIRDLFKTDFFNDSFDCITLTPDPSITICKKIR
jgi:hypothetical protein